MVRRQNTKPELDWCACLLAEIGDISRFGSARKLASWAGLTPTVRGSDRTVHHGHISKQGLRGSEMSPGWLTSPYAYGRA